MTGMRLRRECEKLTSELMIARRLKEEGKKSAENYACIGIHYYMYQALHRAYKRLADIKSDDELNETMSALENALNSVNALGKDQEKTGIQDVDVIERLIDGELMMSDQTADQSGEVEDVVTQIFKTPVEHESTELEIIEIIDINKLIENL